MPSAVNQEQSKYTQHIPLNKQMIYDVREWIWMEMRAPYIYGFIAASLERV